MTFGPTDIKVSMTVFMEASPLCLLNNPHLFGLTQLKFISSITLPSHA